MTLNYQKSQHFLLSLTFHVYLPTQKFQMCHDYQQNPMFQKNLPTP
jgi:hypothetical protein